MSSETEDQPKAQPAQDPSAAPAPVLPGLEVGLPGRGTTIWLATSSFLAVLLLFLLGQFFVLLNLPVGLMMTSLLVFGAAGLFFPAILRRSPLVFTGLRVAPASFIGLAFVIGLVNIPVANVLMGIAQEVLPKDWSDLAEDTTRMLTEAAPAARVLLLIAAGIAAPIGEELFFRGWMQNLLVARFRGLPSVVIVAVVFSATHGDPVGFVARIELGVLFGLSRLWTGSLWPGITMHATHNLVSTAMLYLGDDQSEDTPIDWRMATLWMTAGALIVIALMAQLRRMTERTRAAEVVPAPVAPGLAGWIVGVDTLLIAASAAGLFLFGSKIPGGPLPTEPPKPTHAQHGPRHLK